MGQEDRLTFKTLRALLQVLYMDSSYDPKYRAHIKNHRTKAGIMATLQNEIPTMYDVDTWIEEDSDNEIIRRWNSIEFVRNYLVRDLGHSNTHALTTSEYFQQYNSDYRKRFIFVGVFDKLNDEKTLTLVAKAMQIPTRYHNISLIVQHNHGDYYAIILRRSDNYIHSMITSSADEDDKQDNMQYLEPLRKFAEALDNARITQAGREYQLSVEAIREVRTPNYQETEEDDNSRTKDAENERIALFRAGARLGPSILKPWNVSETLRFSHKKGKGLQSATKIIESMARV